MKKILIIEDDTDTLDVMELILHENGFAVIKANRRVSIEEIAAIKPDLIILDLLLTFGLGTEICLETKKNSPTKHIPVILYSVHNDIQKYARESKADAYIAKPFNIDDMLSLVRKIIL